MLLLTSLDVAAVFRAKHSFDGLGLKFSKPQVRRQRHRHEQQLLYNVAAKEEEGTRSSHDYSTATLYVAAVWRGTGVCYVLALEIHVSQEDEEPLQGFFTERSDSLI